VAWLVMVPPPKQVCTRLLQSRLSVGAPTPLNRFAVGHQDQSHFRARRERREANAHTTTTRITFIGSLPGPDDRSAHAARVPQSCSTPSVLRDQTESLMPSAPESRCLSPPSTWQSERARVSDRWCALRETQPERCHRSGDGERAETTSTVAEQSAARA
jgi:hypothetical protein